MARRSSCRDQLLVYLPVNLDRIIHGAVYQMNKHPGALHVAQELMTKSDARVRAFGSARVCPP